MGTELTKKQFTAMLKDPNIVKAEDLAIFRTIYSFDNHSTHASQVGRLLGVGGSRPASPINLEIGRLAKRLNKEYDIQFTLRTEGKYKFWDIFFNGWDEGRFWIWQLKPNLIAALEETGLIDDIPFPEEIPMEDARQLFEGTKRTITVNSYERNYQAVKECKKHYGTRCCVCGFDFEKTYGKLGKGFIHVHHLIQISSIGCNYEIDPIKDLRPVCPNCHAMLHRDQQISTVDELKKMLVVDSQ